MKYFCADLHANREGFAVLNRPHKTAGEMTTALIHGINLRVQRNDILYILGDIAFSWKETVNVRQKIRCKNIFVTRGNHDISLGQLKRIFGEHFVDNILDTKIRDLHLVLCHYPLLFWDQSHHGAGCLHGHLHNQRTETYMNLLPDIRLLDVSFDSAKEILCGYYPFSEDEVYFILNSRKGHDDVEFYTKKSVYKKEH